MGRPRKPASELELNGSFRKDPQRRRIDPEPKAGIGAPPKRLSQLERTIWRELVADSIPGALKDNDRSQFETLCRLKAIERKDGIGGRAGLSASLLGQMNALAAKFGMTPADRTKLAAPQGKSKPKYDEFDELDSPLAEFDPRPREQWDKPKKPN
jgi:phage terminase small subunit